MRVPWRRLTYAGDSAILLEFAQTIDPTVSRVLHSTAAAVRGAAIAGMWGIVPAYASLLLEFDPLVISGPQVAEALESLDITITSSPPRLFEVPVAYGGAFGPDLEAVAAGAGTSAAAVVAAHTAQPYLIYCIGFAPGFPMCGTLPDALQLARRSSPRTAVPAGSVAIAGAQTGIYPLRSPGGWHLLGRTPARLFHLDREPPVLYRPGDFLQFRSVGEAEFAELERAVAGGREVVREVAGAQD
ncbi:MAG: 5-oxoprolinase subunit PxpB [Candidatus Dormibacteria bacterium]